MRRVGWSPVIGEGRGHGKCERSDTMRLGDREQTRPDLDPASPVYLWLLFTKLDNCLPTTMLNRFQNKQYVLSNHALIEIRLYLFSWAFYATWTCLLLTLFLQHKLCLHIMVDFMQNSCMNRAPKLSAYTVQLQGEALFVLLRQEVAIPVAVPLILRTCKSIEFRNVCDLI